MSEFGLLQEQILVGGPVGAISGRLDNSQFQPSQKESSLVEWDVAFSLCPLFVLTDPSCVLIENVRTQLVCPGWDPDRLTTT